MSATVTLTVTDHWTDGKRIHVVGTLSFGAGAYIQGGLTLNLQNDLIKSNQIPLYVSLLGQTYYYAGAQVDYSLRYKNGTGIQNGTVVIIFGGVELTGNLPANLIASSITFYGLFPKFI